jgi:hypothetical protein
MKLGDKGAIDWGLPDIGVNELHCLFHVLDLEKGWDEAFWRINLGFNVFCDSGVVPLDPCRPNTFKGVEELFELEEDGGEGGSSERLSSQMIQLDDQRGQRGAKGGLNKP